MERDSENVFVYGTLRKGHPLHRHIEDAGLTLVGEGKIRGRLFDLGEYPGAVPSDSDDEEIKGEVYRLTDPGPQLRELDEVEGFDPESPGESLFVRRLTDVRLESGKTIRAWAYFLPREPAKPERIRDGDYARRKRGPEAG